MRFLYVSRLFNRVGHAVLKHLVEKTAFHPDSILLAPPGRYQFSDDPVTISRERRKYLQEISFYHADNIKFFGSCSTLAREHGIPMLDLRSLKDEQAFQRLKCGQFDFILIGGGWPELIPKRIIGLPKLGILNMHPSLLPEFRGTDVHRWQVLEGIRASGITIHYIDESFDTGDILAQKKVALSETDFPQRLADKVALCAGPVVHALLRKLRDTFPNSLTGITQNSRNTGVQTYGKWKWRDIPFLQLDFSRSALDCYRMVLACTQESYQYNGPWFFLKDRPFIVRAASYTTDLHQLEAGTVNHQKPGSLQIACKTGFLVPQKIQPTSMEELRNGHHEEPAMDIEDFRL